MNNKKSITITFPFRSFHNQTFNYKVGLFFLLPPLFNLAVIAGLNYIMQGWGFVMQYGVSKLISAGRVIYIQYSIFHVNFFLPSLVLSAAPPTVEVWWYTTFITTGLFLLSFLIKESFTPFKYYFRAAIILVWCTQVYFYMVPTSFPYDIAIYTRNGFLQVFALLIVTPWIFCLTYYVYGYRFISKIALTTLTLNYLIILAPFQYLLNAILIYHFSLLLMPLLFFFAGLLMNILCIVAFYAYGISMEYRYPKYKQ